MTRNRIPFGAARRSRTLWLFLGWTAFSLLYNIVRFRLSAGQSWFSAAYYLRWMAYSVIYAVAAEYASGRRNAGRMLRVTVGAGVAFAVFGIIQAAFLPNFAFILNPQAIPGVDFDMQGHRLVSTFLDPNLACAFLDIGALTALAFYLQGIRRWLLTAVLLVLAALFTLSRGGILGLAVGGILLFMGSRHARKRLGVTVILVVGIIVASLPWWLPTALNRDRFSISDQSALSRFHDWELAGRIVGQHPLVGVGFDTFGFVAPHFGLALEGNSSFGLAGDLLFIPVVSGLPGFAIYLLMAGGTFRTCAHLVGSADAWERAVGSGVRSATVASIIASLFTTVLLFPPTAALLWLLWAVAEKAESTADQIAERDREKDPLSVGVLPAV